MTIWDNLSTSPGIRRYVATPPNAFRSVIIGILRSCSIVLNIRNTERRVRESDFTSSTIVVPSGDANSSIAVIILERALVKNPVCFDIVPE